MALEIYTLLGIQTSASHEEVKKAFKMAALANHPDKGGTSEAMATVSSYLRAG